VNPIEGMKVIVTGAASGIGAAAAGLLLSRGARVMAADLSQVRIEEAAWRWRPAGVDVLIAHGFDVRSAADCDRMAARAEAEWGAIDALVHCAGILRPPGARPRPLYDLDEAEYEAVIGTNLKGTFLVNRAVLRSMLKRRSGQIVNLSSTSGRKGRPLDSLYSASKAGVIGLCESIAEEARPYGIRVQAILPDAVDTPLWRQNGILGSAPPEALPAVRVAEAIVWCLGLPLDTICENFVLMPVRTRGRRGAQLPEAPEKSTETER